MMTILTSVKMKGNSIYLIAILSCIFGVTCEVLHLFEGLLPIYMSSAFGLFYLLTIFLLCWPVSHFIWWSEPHFFQCFLMVTSTPFPSVSAVHPFRFPEFYSRDWGATRAPGRKPPTEICGPAGPTRGQACPADGMEWPCVVLLSLSVPVPWVQQSELLLWVTI